MNRKKVVIVGAGFGGLNTAKKLSEDQRFEIFILDRRNYHLFQPLLYQVAMAGLSPADIAMPVRSIFSGYSNVHVYLDEVTDTPLGENKVITKNSEFSYDYLALACGTQQSYFGHSEWEEYAPGLKSIEQATEIRRRVLTAFEEAEKTDDLDRQQELLTFVVIGGGPTGVELAGALGEICNYALAKDYQRADTKKAKILLLEGGPRILPSFSEWGSAKAVKDLNKLGVEVRVNSLAKDIHGGGVEVNGATIKASTTLWAAGVKQPEINQKLGEKHGVELDRTGRVIVEKDLSLKKHPNVFVMGDQANFSHDLKEPLPGVAAVAIQQGRYLAKELRRRENGKAPKAFKYWDKGQMATIGRKRAVVESGSLKFSGFFAWILWLAVHIYYLIGFRNRIVVLFLWAWSYFTYRKGAQLIVEKEWRSHSSK